MTLDFCGKKLKRNRTAVTLKYVLFLTYLSLTYIDLYSPEVRDHNISTMTTIITNLCKEIVREVYIHTYTISNADDI